MKLQAQTLFELGKNNLDLSLELTQIALQAEFALLRQVVAQEARCADLAERALTPQSSQAPQLPQFPQIPGGLPSFSPLLAWDGLSEQVAGWRELADASLTQQKAFAAAWQNALQTWQQRTVANLEQEVGAVPFSSTLREGFNAWTQLFTSGLEAFPRKD